MGSARRARLELVVCALSLIYPVQMLRYSIYLSGRILDCFLRAIRRDLRLLSRGSCAIRRGLSLFGLQLRLLCL